MRTVNHDDTLRVRSISLHQCGVKPRLMCCSACEKGRGVFTLSRHGRPLDWPVVAQEVWRWPGSQVNVDTDVWQACLRSLGLGSERGAARG